MNNEYKPPQKKYDLTPKEKPDGKQADLQLQLNDVYEILEVLAENQERIMLELVQLKRSDKGATCH